MKIAVCLSNVPDTATKIKISADEKNIETAGVSFIINPYDEFAIEEALQTAEKNGGTVTYFTVGTDASKEMLRKALAMGGEDAVLIKTDAASDSFTTASLLADAIKPGAFDLVFCGKQSVDYDSGAVGIILGEMLGFNTVSVCVDFSLDGNKVTAVREIEGGKETVETSLPCLITAQKGLNTPRYANVKGIMAAKKKPLNENSGAQVNVKTQTIKLIPPAAKSAGRILGTDVSVVPELVRLLREEAKVI